MSSESISALCNGAEPKALKGRSRRTVGVAVARLYFFHSGRQVLDEKLPQVVQSLQLFGLKSQEEGKENGESANRRSG